MPTTQRQPLTRDAKHYPPSNPEFLLQGHWLVDHKHSDSLRKHLQAMGVSEMACVAGDKLVISMIMQLTGQGLECTQVSQLGTKSRTLPPSSPIVETQKSGSAVQFLLQSAQSASVTLHIAGPGFNIVEDRSLKEGDQDTLVQKLVLQKPGEDALVTTRYFLRQHKPPPPPPETAGRAAV